jgi:hypothetical protein
MEGVELKFKSGQDVANHDFGNMIQQPVSKAVCMLPNSFHAQA